MQTTEQTVPNLRNTQRQRMLKGATIVFNNGNSTLSCVLRNLSAGGARLQLDSVIGVPDQFDLMISGAGRRPCQVAWRDGHTLGIVYLDAA